MWWRKRQRLEEAIQGIREELRAIRELLERQLLPSQSAPSDTQPLLTDRAATPAARTASTPSTSRSERLSETQMMQQLEHLLRARQLRLNRYLEVQSRGPLDEEMYHLGFASL